MLSKIEADLDAMSIGSFSFTNMSWDCNNNDVPIAMSIFSNGIVLPPASINVQVSDKIYIIEVSDPDNESDGDIMLFMMLSTLLLSESSVKLYLRCIA